MLFLIFIVLMVFMLNSIFVSLTMDKQNKKHIKKIEETLTLLDKKFEETLNYLHKINASKTE
jgi:hypothetical protein